MAAVSPRSCFRKRDDSMASFMEYTMQRQPEDLRQLLSGGWPQARAAADLLNGSSRIVLAGTGTSLHAAMVGSWLFRAAGVDAIAASSFDFSTYPGQFGIGATDAVIVLAHTGETGFSARAMTDAAASGATVLSVGCLTAQHVGPALTLRTVPLERAATYTASHLTAMTVLAQIAIEYGSRTGVGRMDQLRDSLQQIPEMVQSALSRKEEVAAVAAMAVDRRVYAIGSGPNEATALELVIKVREAAFASIDGMSAEQFLHGPIVAMNADDLLVAVNPAGSSTQRLSAIASVALSLGAHAWHVGDAPVPAGATQFALPSLPEVLSPLLAVVPMQMLSLEMANLRGTNPDEFRWDDPQYRLSFERLTL
ncbi:hypothetical protein BH23CHL5_BH23CHL5_17550 [soil metagenome]